MTDLPPFTTQTWPPPVVIAHGSSNPQPRTLTPDSGPVGVAETEDPPTAAPTGDVDGKATRVALSAASAPAAALRRKKATPAAGDGLLKGTKVHHTRPQPHARWPAAVVRLPPPGKAPTLTIVARFTGP